VDLRCGIGIEKNVTFLKLLGIRAMLQGFLETFAAYWSRADRGGIDKGFGGFYVCHVCDPRDGRILKE